MNSTVDKQSSHKLWQRILSKNELLKLSKTSHSYAISKHLQICDPSYPRLSFVPRGPKSRNNKKRLPTSSLAPTSVKKKSKVSASRPKMTNLRDQLTSDSLKIWSKFSAANCTQERKIELIEELIHLIKGNIDNIVFKGNASRVIQSIIKYGLSEHKQFIFNELKGKVLELSKNRYSHFIAIRMIRRGTKEQIKSIFNEFRGSVPTLVKHQYASAVFQTLYEHVDDLHANILIEELYSSEFIVFENAQKRTFKQLLTEYSEKKHIILNNLEKNISTVLNKENAGLLLKRSLLHIPILNLIEHADKEVRELILFSLKNYLSSLVSSKEGTKIAILCMIRYSTKDRKSVVKSLKSQVETLCFNKYGHLNLLNIFSILDDTVLVSTLVLDKIKNSLLKLSTHPVGSNVVVYLLNPNSKGCAVSAKMLSEMSKIDSPEENADQLVSSSKKDPQTRISELYNYIYPTIEKMITYQTFRLVTNVYAKHIVLEAISSCHDPLQKNRYYQSILRLVGPTIEKIQIEEEQKDQSLDFFAQELPVEEDLMSHLVAHRFIRKLIEEDDQFSTELLEKLKKIDMLVEYASRPISSWVILSLLESKFTGQNILHLLRGQTRVLRESARLEEQYKATGLIVKILEKNGE